MPKPKKDKELRFTIAEIRATDAGGLTGYAAIYNSRSVDIPGVGYEVIRPGAFDKSVESANNGERDLTLNASHNEMYTLGSVALGNLQVSSDEHGLRFDVPKLPDADYAQAIREAVKEGVMDKCSFGFIPVKEKRTADGVRELLDVNLLHMTICRGAIAAYQGTDVEARSNEKEYRTVGEYVDDEVRIYKSVDEVPDYVPADKKKQFLDIWNSSYKAAKGAGMSDKDAESKAFAEASGVVKKEARAVKHLVTESDGTQHLPVTNEDGTASHNLMGSAWAALHGGYRGNKYEGPDKDKAIAKLKAMYKAEGMEPPNERSIEGSDELTAELRSQLKLQKKLEDADAKTRDQREAELAATLAATQAKVQELEAEVREQRMFRTTAESRAAEVKDQAVKVPELEKAVTQLRLANIELDAEVKGLKPQTLQLPGLHAELKDLRAAKESLETGNAALSQQAAKVPELERGFAEARAVNLDLEAENAGLRQQTIQLPGLHQELKELKDIRAAKASLEAINADLSQQAAKIPDLERSFAEARTANLEIQAENAGLKQQNEQLPGLHVELREKRTALAAVEAQLAILQPQTARVSELEQAFSEERMKRADAEAQLPSLRSQVARIPEMETAMSQARAEKRDAESKLTDLQQANEKLEAEKRGMLAHFRTISKHQKAAKEMRSQADSSYDEADEECQRGMMYGNYTY